MEERVNQDLLREQLKNFIKMHGTKSRFISAQIGLEESVLCRFKGGTRCLYEDTARDLKQWLDKHDN